MGWFDFIGGGGGVERGLDSGYDPGMSIPHQYEGGGTSSAGGFDPEAARLRALGQQVPSGVTMEGPGDYVDPAEQKILFPSGLPSRDKSGGLAQLSSLSRYADLLGGGPGTGGTPGSPPHTAAATTPATPAGGQVNWMSSAPDAFAKTDRDMRQLNQWENLAGDIGKWIRTAAMASA